MASGVSGATGVGPGVIIYIFIFRTLPWDLVASARDFGEVLRNNKFISFPDYCQVLCTGLVKKSTSVVFQKYLALRNRLFPLPLDGGGLGWGCEYLAISTSFPPPPPPPPPPRGG